MKKKEYLLKELERLRKQQGKVQVVYLGTKTRLKPLVLFYEHHMSWCGHVSIVPGELLRKKRREKDGHKDPLLQEIGQLQEEVMAQISSLRKDHEAAEKKRNEIEKVALILGLNPSDQPSRTSKQPKVQEDEPQPAKKKRELERSPKGQEASSSSAAKVQVLLRYWRRTVRSIARFQQVLIPAQEWLSRWLTDSLYVFLISLLTGLLILLIVVYLRFSKTSSLSEFLPKLGNNLIIQYIGSLTGNFFLPGLSLFTNLLLIIILLMQLFWV